MKKPSSKTTFCLARGRVLTIGKTSHVIGRYKHNGEGYVC
jgi:hypothetical protein